MMRRVAGYHDIRMDGMTDLVMRARGASVLDVGCNRGLVGFEFANNGATLVHGCDIYEQGIITARELFADLRSVKCRFEVVDLTQGSEGMTSAFGEDYPNRYDIVVMLATYHKLKRTMPPDALSKLMKHFGKKTERYFAWRGTSGEHDQNAEEMQRLDRDLGSTGLKRMHTSNLSEGLGAAAIWVRQVG